MEFTPPADDLSSFLSMLPDSVRQSLEKNANGLVEVVLDLGRRPEARYLDGQSVLLSETFITQADLDAAVKKLGEFSGDNRAGIERTLHRISAMRNRTGKVVGLTCRVGRAISGTIDIIRDLVESGKSILFLGPPGVGKTTKLREMARVLSDEFKKRVIVIDTSNEIAGDGDVPHPAIGRSRRMQVSHPNQQHAVMIEAVENHTPEVIIIDEIGTEEEAAAARTIAERGVTLIGTAHGNALENLLKNPTLVDLVGGIETVTLGDEEARRRGTQKTVLERSNQPTFEICVELLDKQNLAVHKNVSEAVDQLLRGWKIHPEVRRKDESTGAYSVVQHEAPTVVPPAEGLAPFVTDWVQQQDTYLKIYPYAVSKGQLERVVKTLQLPVSVVKSIDEADAILALRSYARSGAKIHELAEARQIPVYVVKSNNVPQIQRALREALHLDTEGVSAVEWESDITDETELALEETRQAISRVLDRLEPIELAPRRAYIRRLQHQLVEQHHLTSRSIGDEPTRRLRILPPASAQKSLGYI